MSENNKNINSSEFKKYFSDKLDSDEKVVFENNIEVDSFESEALEGFQSLNNNALVTSSIVDVENRISKRTGLSFGKTKSIPIWKPLSIAASMILVFGSIYYISNLFKNDEKLADNSLPKPKEVEAVQEDFTPTFSDSIEDDNSINMDIVEEMDAPELEAVTSNKTKDNSVKNSPNIALPEPTNFEVVEDSYLKEEITSKKIAAPKIERNASSASESVNLDSNKEVASVQNMSAVAADEEIITSFQSGKVNYQNKNYNTAIENFQKSSSENINVIESEYYIAMSYYNLNNYSKALKSFDTVIGSNSSLSNNAKWYKSVVLLEQGKKAESKALLEELSQGSSGFKNQALDKLKTID